MTNEETGWELTWLANILQQAAGSAEPGALLGSCCPAGVNCVHIQRWTGCSLGWVSPCCCLLLVHMDSGGRVRPQPRPMMTAPRGWQCSIFIYVAALYLAALEGKGHFCAYPIARTHRPLQRRSWPPLLTSAQEGEEQIDLPGGGTVMDGLAIRIGKSPGLGVGDPGSRPCSDFQCHHG